MKSLTIESIIFSSGEKILRHLAEGHDQGDQNGADGQAGLEGAKRVKVRLEP